ncbi:MAG TPA: iron-sulfur cluster assembly scaffold protein [Thermodesulfobacteriota bacterium]
MSKKNEDRMALIIDHYENPRNYGARDDADVIQKWGNPGCGDIVTIYLNIDNKGIINNVTFEGEGCTLSQAATSIITDIVIGKTIEEVENMGSNVISDIVGLEVAMSRPKCATLGLTSVKMAINEWQRKKKLDIIKQDKSLSK